MTVHAQPPASVRTACPYCGVGCGVLATPDMSGGVAIAGDPMHPANFGALCSKGMALADTLGFDGRLLHPMVRRNGELARVDWTTALARVAEGFSRIIARDGPDAVALYLSGQLLTEDYYVANKLMKGFIGSANVDTNSRLCMASSVAGHRRAFGADTVPGAYADLDEADLMILVGSNAAWCHPVLFQRMVANKRERGARLIVIDPRRTVTAEAADLFLPIAPGTDTALFCGLLAHLAEAGALDDAYIGNHTTGFAAAVARAREVAPDAAATARTTGLDPAGVVAFFGAFRATPRTITCYSQGVNQSAQGTDKVNAIVNCHLATGRIGKPAMGPFSLTGQPNAMGGREVGGLANQLAAHMGFTSAEVDRVRRFWQAPRMATREGLKAVDLFEAIEAGSIKALWVMATNPAVSLPRAGAMGDALARLDLFVVSETVRSNDTIESGAHVLLPAAAWGEKDGTVTNSERRITRQRAFMAPPGEARPDWKIVTQVARRMGFEAGFAYRSAADVFREHAALSGFENRGRRDFDLGGLADISDIAYAALDPVQWPLRAQGKPRQRRFFANGGFFTPERKARFIAPERPSLRQPTSEAFPFRLNTGRLRDQWHTMTRSGMSPRLALHSPEPCVEINPADARAAGLEASGFARVTTRHGSVVLRVAISDTQQPGSLFVPIHWSRATASSARIGDLVAAETDPHSGQPELKATPAAIAPVRFASRGFAISRRALALPAPSWWARIAVVGGTAYLLASNDDVLAWQAAARHLFTGVEAVEFAEYIDAPRGLYRSAAFAQGRLEGCLFVGRSDGAPHWDAVQQVFASETVAAAQRRMVLSGKSADGRADTGPVICSCFGVGLNAIRAFLRSGATATVEQIGQALRAGTNCGSCLPELKRIVQGTVQATVQATVQGTVNERVAV